MTDTSEGLRGTASPFAALAGWHTTDHDAAWRIRHPACITMLLPSEP